MARGSKAKASDKQKREAEHSAEGFVERGVSKKEAKRRVNQLGKNMPLDQTGPKNIDEYIAGFPRDVQVIIEKIRLTIRKAAPEAEDTIKYGMPTFTLKGNLVYFSAFKKHIGFYPPLAGTAKFKKELSAYEGPKGSLRFPIDKPIPYGLISRIVKFRAKENSGRAEDKGKKK